MKRLAVAVSGIVQGVGFRPFVWRLAGRLHLAGTVLNTARGVEIEIEGDGADCDAFLAALTNEAPPAARVGRVDAREIPPKNEAGFRILASAPGERDTLISPDLGVCADCAREVLDPADRRHGYPFTNCTNCGPRFSIVRDVPYDRKNTTMAPFAMCRACKSEYDDPADRRFHAQPNACPDCGPRVTFSRDGHAVSGDWLEAAGNALDAGLTVAVKGIGGYHLMCDARSAEAVRRVRLAKARDSKPLAVMVRDIDVARRYCAVRPEEEALLTSARKPIALLKKLPACALPDGIAPDNARLGVLLPYTPLHLLLCREHPVLVATSLNVSGDETAYADDDPALLLADCVLENDRGIHRRIDDSVAFCAAGGERIIRRARGYAPEPLPFAGAGAILAFGAQDKNTFCMARGSDAIVSSHIGDLDDLSARQAMEREIPAYARIFGVRPAYAACDLHPDYASTREAAKSGLPVTPVQHHHAHFASALAENGWGGEAIGVVFDGSGYGLDGRIWGSELLFGTVGCVERLGHGLYAPLPGGEAAVREPWRMALAMLDMAAGRNEALRFFPHRPEAATLLATCDKGINAPLSCGMGRLFDAVAVIAGLAEAVGFEGQNAMALEAALDENADGTYAFSIGKDLTFDWRPVILAAHRDRLAGADAGTVSVRFHRAVVSLVTELCVRARQRTGCGAAALSGGVFQNVFLLENCARELRQKEFALLLNAKVPANDGGISYGQAAASAAILERSDGHVPCDTRNDR